MNINWKVRLSNKTFWITIVPAILLLAQQILSLFGIQFEVANLQKQLVEIITTVFTILAVIGIVNDPTTAGLNDSKQAMKYETPKVS